MGASRRPCYSKGVVTNANPPIPDNANLLDKVWAAHAVRELPSGQTQLFIGLHLIHEVTSPQAFAMLREMKLPVRFPERTLATVDHIIPTLSQQRPLADDLAEKMMSALEENCAEHGIRLLDTASGQQGIVHVIGPELGLTQPGMTIACGDSHTSTHGAFGAIALGIGTSQVRDVLASQCLALAKPRVRRIDVGGKLMPGVYAKDGARCGYANPDETTFEYLRGREFAPQGAAFDRAVHWWKSLASAPNASYDDRVEVDGNAIAPSVSWGINPGQNLGVDERLPRPADAPDDVRASLEEAYSYMSLKPGEPIAGTPINVAFIGSCTNGRISDLREAARVARTGRVAPGVKALVVPGSQAVAREAEAEGLHEVFRAAGFEWRLAGCSMCLAMNPDKLIDREICASSSNRNFKGRQGSPTGRTLLMSPAMVAAAAIAGRVVDVRETL